MKPAALALALIATAFAITATLPAPKPAATHFSPIGTDPEPCRINGTC